jgi:hypothetical protein
MLNTMCIIWEKIFKANVILFLVFSPTHSSSQSVSAYGEIKNGNDKLERVLITVFENDTFYKKTYTNIKGNLDFGSMIEKAISRFFTNQAMIFMHTKS